MENLPFDISLFFGLTSLTAVLFFYHATRHSKATIIILLAWLGLQTFIGLSGFCTFTNTIPPRFLLLVLPPIIFVIGLFLTSKGRQFIDSLNIKTLTILHIIRIPVEIVLYLLFIHKAVPKLMTFEGRNFDILAGLSAPIIFYFGFIKNRIPNNIILLWNFICLGLLMNIVVNAVLSAPFTFQKFGFDQPNVAILYFPFIWLPSCIVPIVLLSHLVTIRQIVNARSQKSND
jgi:hypothetical protein